jgi:hypothetical protein
MSRPNCSRRTKRLCLAAVGPSVRCAAELITLLQERRIVPITNDQELRIATEQAGALLRFKTT